MAAVGAFQDDDRGENSGSAYVFIRSGTLWSQQVKLTASDGAAYDYFGYSLAILGDVVIVGAHQDDDRGNNSGSAYVFSRSGTLWSQQSKLTAADGAGGDDFGWSVSASKDTAVVGARREDGGGYNSGSAYLFWRSGTLWSPQAKLTASDSAASDSFGHAVCVSGDTLAVGAHYDDDRGDASGSAYVFSRSGTLWSEQAKLTAADGAKDDYLGCAVAVAGDMVAVGAQGDDDRGASAGSAYTFQRSGTVWSQQQKLTAVDSAENDSHGGSVSMSGTTTVVGAHQHGLESKKAGAAYVYVRVQGVPDAGLDAAVDALAVPDLKLAVDQSPPDAIASADQAAPDQMPALDLNPLDAKAGSDQALPDQKPTLDFNPLDAQAGPDQALPDQKPALDFNPLDAKAGSDQALPDQKPAQDVSTLDGPAANADQTPPPGDDCSCRMGGAPGRLPAPLLLFGLGLVALVLRRH